MTRLFVSLFLTNSFSLYLFVLLAQVVTVQDYWVKPRSADINENVLSEQAREELGLSEELIRTKGNSLDQVLSQVRQHVLGFGAQGLPCFCERVELEFNQERENLLGDFDACAVRKLSLQERERERKKRTRCAVDASNRFGELENSNT